MPELFLLFVIPTANLMMLLFLGFYLHQLKNEKKVLEDKARELAKKENEVNSDFHQSVDKSLSEERKIIDGATEQAKSILTDTKYVSDSSKKVIDEALAKMIGLVEQEVETSSKDMLDKHKNSLTEVSGKSLNNLQNITKQFETNLEMQMQDFQKSLLPNLQKELEEYKQQKFKEANDKVNKIIQQVSQKVLNKSLSADDHQNLIIESLEKFRKDGLFD